MIEAAALDLVGPRWGPFVYTIDFIPGVALTGTTWAMQIREYPDATGAPLVDLTMAVANAQGLSLSSRVDDGVTISTIQIRISETTMEGLRHWQASGREPGSPANLAYDLVGTGVVIEGVTIPKSPFYEGSFTVKPGVTQ